MSTPASDLRQILTQQRAELRRHVAAYVEVEREFYSHTDGVNYDSLDQGAKAAYTRKLNELTKKRNDLAEKTKNAKARVSMTTSLCDESASDSPPPAGTTDAPARQVSNARLPKLPPFRGDKKDAVQGAYEFLDEVKALLEANMVPESRWVSAMLPALTTTDREWAAAKLKGLDWDQAERLFLSHFESPAIKDKLLKALMEIKMQKRESVQRYSDRFSSLMRRAGMKDDDSSLIAVYIRGLDPKLQEMLYVARATQLTLAKSNGQEIADSIDWQIQNAIALDAARSESHTGKRPHSDANLPEGTSINDASKKVRKRCEKCKRWGHSTSEHIDNHKPKLYSNPRGRFKEGPKKGINLCYTCKNPWKPGHKCNNKDPESNNMEVTEMHQKVAISQELGHISLGDQNNTEVKEIPKEESKSEEPSDVSSFYKSNTEVKGGPKEGSNSEELSDVSSYCKGNTEMKKSSHEDDISQELSDVSIDHSNASPAIDHSNAEVTENPDFSQELSDISFGDQLADAILTPNTELGAIEKTPNENGDLIHTPVIINGIKGMALVDSGATHSFISTEFAQSHNLKLTKVEGFVRGATGENVAPRTGTTLVTVQNGTRTVQCSPEWIKLPKGRDLVIGLADFKTFGYYIKGVPAKSPDQYEDTEPIHIEFDPEDEKLVESSTALDLSLAAHKALSANQRIPLSSRCTHPLAVLKIKPTSNEPIWRRVNYVQPKDYERVSARVNEWFNGNVTEKAPHTAVNSFPLLSVPRKDAQGNKVDIRPCLDLRPLNPRLKDIPYPLPKIQEILDRLGSAHGKDVMYSTIDVKDGYFRFRIPEEDRNWVAFKWNGVHYRFKCAPFGIKTMTAQFQRLMDKIFGDLPFVAVYVRLC